MSCVGGGALVVEGNIRDTVDRVVEDEAVTKGDAILSGEKPIEGLREGGWGLDWGVLISCCVFVLGSGILVII